MRLHASSRRRGMSLAEVLVFSIVFTLLSVGVLRTVGEGRVIQGNAQARIGLSIAAQSELDRLRATASTLAPGTTRRELASGELLDVTVEEHPSGLLALRVEASRRSARGLRPVVLETLVRRSAP